MAKAFPKTKDCAQVPVRLHIVSKSKTNWGIEYVGFSESKFYRLSTRAQLDKCLWDAKYDLKVGHFYELERKHSPRSTDLKNPHAREHLVVGANKALEIQRTKVTLFSLLRSEARESVWDVFGGLECHHGDWIGFEEGTECPSVGVLKSSRNQFKVYKYFDPEIEKEYPRLTLHSNGDFYDLPISYISTFTEEEQDAGEDGNQEVLLLLGLGRPWSNWGKLSPARCHVLVIGIFQEDQGPPRCYTNFRNINQGEVQASAQRVPPPSTTTDRRRPRLMEEYYFDIDPCFLIRRLSSFGELHHRIKGSLQDVFRGLECRHGDWIGFEEGTECPSVGFLRCRRNQFEIYKYFNPELGDQNRRLFLHSDGRFYDLPINDVPKEDAGEDDGEEVVLLLGLGRPWDNEGKLSPARRYVVVLDICWEKHIQVGQENIDFGVYPAYIA